VSFIFPGIFSADMPLPAVLALQSPRLPGDFSFEDVSELLTPIDDLPDQFLPRTTPVRDQGLQECCVGYAAAAMSEFHARTYKNVTHRLSPQFIHSC
jgi:hypothetical protein